MAFSLYFCCPKMWGLRPSSSCFLPVPLSLFPIKSQPKKKSDPRIICKIKPLFPAQLAPLRTIGERTFLFFSFLIGEKGRINIFSPFLAVKLSEKSLRLLRSVEDIKGKEKAKVSNHPFHPLYLCAVLSPSLLFSTLAATVKQGIS